MKINTKELGLKCGIEIHSQLEGKKLFCSCPTLIRDDETHFSVMRRLHATAGEEGHIDIAAKQEAKKERIYVYHGHQDSTCLVELDETPPEHLNGQAFLTALQVGKMLKGNFVDSANIMRKIVIDGSNTSGFQRTALIARNGTIASSLGNVRIATIILEEDACRILKESNTEVNFILDRLGIPLLEIATEPDIKSPEHCKEVSEKIGLLIRSTGKAKRGLGTIRQDVNVSIEGGTRVEIKGAQDLKMIPTLVEYEALRQKTLLDIKEELEKRHAKQFIGENKDVTKILKNSGSKIISKTIERGDVILGVKLPKFARLVGKEVQPKKRLGTEFSDRAKIIAGVGGLFHSDEELKKYSISDKEVEFLKQELGCLDDDAFVIVADSKERSEKALKAVVDRANELFEGVPKEVRKANQDGTTSYLRPMPGASRMYPETDMPSVSIDKEILEEIELPELIEDKSKRYEKMGLAKDLADLTAKSEKAALFDHFAKNFPELKPAYIAEILMTSARTIKRQHGVDINPSENDFRALFASLVAQQITKESVLEILRQNKPVPTIIHDYCTITDTELRAALKKIVLENKGATFNSLIGTAMKQLRGKASGEKIAQFLKALAS